jgi:CBS domain-containing protein
MMRIAAATLSSGWQVHRVPVVDDDGVLVGMLSLADCARALEPKNGERVAAEEIANVVAGMRRAREAVTVAGKPRLRRRAAARVTRLQAAPAAAAAAGGHNPV